MRWILLWCLALPVVAQQVTLNDYLAAPQNYGTVVLTRHALAPGGGDPANFDISDCTTQRNLNDVGRQQAQALGATLAAVGFEAVYSSPWCRCMQTAELMNLGEVEPHPGLASFFEGHADRTETLQALNELLQQDPKQKRLMVTHFVVISALTGLGVGSGESVVYDPATKASWRLVIP